MRSNFKPIIILSVILLLSGFTIGANAAFNPQINYQGKLTDINDAIVSDGPYDMVFRLYTTAGGGTAIWTESWINANLFTDSIGTSTNDGCAVGIDKMEYATDTNETTLAAGQYLWNTNKKEVAVIESVNTAGTGGYICIYDPPSLWAVTETITNRIYVKSGLFSVMLGTISSLTGINFNQPFYLGVTVGTDSEMRPRKVLGAVLAAFEARRLEGYSWASPGPIGATTPNAGAFTTLSSTYSGSLTALTVTQSGTGDIVEFKDDNVTVFKIADGGNVTVAGHIFPATTTLYDLGSSSYKWRNLYVATTTVGETIVIGSSLIQGSVTTTLSTLTGSLILNPAGNIGIGTTNPAEKLEIYDGSILANRGHLKFIQESAPGAPTVAVNVATGNLTGTYTYKITFVTSQGETEGGTISASVSPSSQQVDLSNIPLGTEGTVISRKIYRTLANGTQHKLVTTISDNTTTTYTDNIADSSLGVDVPTSNTTGGGIFLGGTNRFQIAQNGNVGIGTASPSAKLTIAGGNILQTAGSPTRVGQIVDSTYLDGAFGVYVSGKYAYMAGSISDALVIIDISNPTSPTRVGQIVDTTYLNGAVSIYVSGKYAYVASFYSKALVIIDISNPTSPTRVGQIVDSTYLDGAFGVYVSGKYAYVAGSISKALVIIDISNPTSPTRVGQIVDSTYLDAANGVYVSGKYAYVTSVYSDTLVIIDISNPTSPTRVGQIVDSTYLDGAFGVYVSGKYAYVTSAYSDALVIIDISNPTSPTRVGQIVDSTYLDGARGVYVSGKYAYVTSYNSKALVIIDISNPASPARVDQISGAGNYLDGAIDVYVSGKYAYVASSNSDALVIIDISGLDVPSAHIGNLSVSAITVTENLDIRNNLYASGLNIGIGGIYSAGPLTVTGLSTSTLSALDVRNSAGTNLLYVQNAGNIGIGTASPAYKLDVRGTGRFSSNLTIEGNLYVNKLSSPTLNSPSTSNSGGNLSGANPTYYYKVTTLNVNGETTPSNEQSIDLVPLSPSSAPNLTINTSGTTYYSYKVSVYTGNGTSTASTATTTTAGANPPNTTITWSEVSGATGYILYRQDTTSTDPWYYLDVGATTTYTDTATTTTFGTQGDAPTTNNARTNTNKVDLTWNQIIGATGYRIYRGTSSGGENVYYEVSGETTTSFTDTGGTSTSGSPPTQNNTGGGGIYAGDILASGNVGIGTTSPSKRLSIVDSGLGFDRPATNTLAFYTDNLERMRIDASGNLGLGTTTPAAKLHVAGHTQIDNNLLAGGSIGIGTTTPTHKLHVEGTGYATSDFRTPIFYDSDNTAYYLDPASTTNSLLVAGNVGIGTTTPDEKLTVIGGAIRTNQAFKDIFGWNTFSQKQAFLSLAHNMGGFGGSVAPGVNFATGTHWSAYDAGNSGGLTNTKQYRGAAFDGRYIYFAPYYDGTAHHGKVLRYDSTASFTSAEAWSAYDAGNSGGLSNTKGYMGAVFDGRYVYFAPYYDSAAYHGKVLRYDTTASFTSTGAWSAYDAGNSGGLSNTKGYQGAVFDGRYIYFVPFYDSAAYHGKVLRYDTTASFTSTEAWSAYDAGNSGGLTTKGYVGAVFDGRYIYFVPNYDGSAHGKVLRYDTTASFTSTGAWSAYDAGNSGGLTTKGYIGAVFDGRYIYFVPIHDGTAYHGKVLRYDTTASFTSTGAWSAYDAGNSGGLTTKGYVGAVFDGRYIYFAPYYDGAYHGKALRYDTTASFVSTGAWSAYDAGNSGGLSNTKGYWGAVFDGRYIYFVPIYDGSAYHGKVLRYDTGSPLPQQGILQVARSKELYINSTGNIGIGTTNPGGGAGSSVLSIYNTNATPTAVTDVSHLFSIGGEGYWMDAAGNITLQTPHDLKSGEWIFSSQNIITGKSLRVDMERLVKDLDKLLGGGYLFEENLFEKGLLDSQGLIEEENLNEEELTEPTEKESLITGFVQKIKQTLFSLGLAIEDGITKVKELVTEKIISKEAEIEKVRIREIEMIDKNTGEIYCVWIEDGQLVEVKGECNPQNSKIENQEEDEMSPVVDIISELESELEEPELEKPKPEPELEGPELEIKEEMKGEEEKEKDEEEIKEESGEDKEEVKNEEIKKEEAKNDEEVI